MSETRDVLADIPANVVTRDRLRARLEAIQADMSERLDDLIHRKALDVCKRLRERIDRIGGEVRDARRRAEERLAELSRSADELTWEKASRMRAAIDGVREALDRYEKELDALSSGVEESMRSALDGPGG